MNDRHIVHGGGGGSDGGGGGGCDCFWCCNIL